MAHYLENSSASRQYTENGGPESRASPRLYIAPDFFFASVIFRPGTSRYSQYG